MPYLNIQTNQTLSDDYREKLLVESSKLVAEGLGKSEEFMMVSIKDDTPMLFGGKSGPTAFLEIKSVGIPANKTKDICQQLCELVHSVASIPPERIYVKFNDVQRSMWGWKGDMFG
ncbi:phenylpyruvate tautomerase MIF-related protein [Cerasicoccus fimbriatus]|uniref:phenylpyruvate tautomerase MIF-related protein n=1 Tax=Cerasicoccus fimbriatus TaxID=3014554 RepID=UPI0022B4840E|nr:phenylpyruvate tautomerase MIF-related protein [Cerasicoccus sp. TK19100]